MSSATATRAPAGTEAQVWKALGDPVRRRVLDLLRIRPRTTGDLAAQFELTRFGVMKHLDKLVEAGLVVVQRKGRERWNHLNAVPLQEIVRRWIDPFEQELADGLLRLRARAERDEHPKAMQETHATLDKLEHVLEVRVAAPRERVWKTLTGDLSAWWPKGFYLGSAPQGFHIEPRLGGRMYEDWGNGEGAIWGRVVVVKREELLQVHGELFGQAGGTALTFQKYTLREEADETVLRLEDTTLGSIDESMRQSLEGGWKFLLADTLKPYIENGTVPEIPETVQARA